MDTRTRIFLVMPSSVVRGMRARHAGYVRALATCSGPIATWSVCDHLGIGPEQVRLSFFSTTTGWTSGTCDSVINFQIFSLNIFFVIFRACLESAASSVCAVSPLLLSL